MGDHTILIEVHLAGNMPRILIGDEVTLALHQVADLVL